MHNTGKYLYIADPKPKDKGLASKEASSHQNNVTLTIELEHHLPWKQKVAVTLLRLCQGKEGKGNKAGSLSGSSSTYF